MDLDATAITPPAATPAPPSSAADRATLLARRFLGWFVDGLLLSTVVGVSGLALMLVSSLFVGATVGLAGGGLEGLAAGGAAGFVAVIGVVLAMHAIAIGTLLGYFAWAARRTGEVAGQTLGHQLAGVRVVRTADPAAAIRGRRLLAREFARYLWLVAVVIAALFVASAADAPALANLIVLIAVGGIIWSSTPDRLPHDRVAGTRVIAWPAGGGVSAAARRAG